MRRHWTRALVLGWVAVAGLACTRAGNEPAPATAEEEVESPPPEPPSLEPPSRPLGPVDPVRGGLVVDLGADFLGASLPPAKIEPGRYGAIANFSQHRFITMERTTRSGVRGQAVLSMEPGGAVEACFRIETDSRSASSKHANRDRVARSSETRGGQLLGVRGRWQGIATTVQIDLDRWHHGDCEVPPDTEADPEPTRLDCIGVGPNDRVASPWIACRLDDPREPLAEMSLLVADSPRAGGWPHRHDPSGHGTEPPQDAHPWLLLAQPALQVDVDDTDRGGTTVELKVSDRTLDTSRWTPPVHESKRTGEPEGPIELPPEVQ